MATDTAPSHQTPTSDHEPIEKVPEEVKPVEPEIVSLAKKTEEVLKPNEVASQSTPLAKSERDVEDKEAEPPAVEVKMIDDAPVVDVPVDDKIEMEKDSIPDSHSPSVLTPVTSVVNGESIAPAKESIPNIKSVPKKEEEQQLSPSLEKLPHEELKTVDVPVSVEEAIEKPHEPSEVLPIKESDPIEAKDTEDSGVLKEVDKPELVIPEVEVKLEEQSEVGKQVEKPKTEEVIEKPEKPLEVLPIKSETVVVKNVEDSEPVFKEDDKPESELISPEMEVKLEEQSEVIKKVEPEEKSVEVIQELAEVLPTKESEAVLVKDIDGSQELSKEADKVEAVAPEPREVKLASEVTEQLEKTEEQPVEAIEKTQDSSEVHPTKESEAVAVKDTDDSVGVLEVDKPESAVPEVEVKQEEQSEVIEQVEKPESSVSQVEVKLEEQPEVTEQVEKPESSAPEVEVKPEEQPEVSTHAEKPKEHEVEVKTEGQSEVSEQVEIKPTHEKPEQVAGITKEAEVDIKEDISSSLPGVIGEVGLEDEKKEAEGTDLVEVSVKEVVVDAEKGGEEKEAKTTKDEGENIASETVKEEPVHPIKVEDVSDVVSNAEVTEKSFAGEKTVENFESAVEDKKDEIPAIDETEKDQNIEGKLDETTIIGSETVKESQDSVLEAKEEERAKTKEENSEQEKVDEIAKSDTQNLQPSTTKSDSEDTKESQDLPREVPVKPTQKHSNNILTKVKQSLVKAKKAIIGKSPTPKTVSSDTKGDVNVNN